MSGLTVTVLGSSGSYATPGNPCTGYLVRSPGAAVLLDCGPGTLGPLQSAIDLADLTAIVVSHCHPDHWMELPVLRNVFLYFQPRDGVPLFGTAETERMYTAVSLPGPPRAEPFDWTIIHRASELEIGDQRWSFRQTDHPVETLATRIDANGRSFMFTSDTGPDWHFTDFDSPIDVVMCDASHLSAYEDMGIPHMSARQAGMRAREAGIPRLVITHLVPGSDSGAHRAEAEAAYGGPVEVAVPGATYDI